MSNDAPKRLGTAEKFYARQSGTSLTLRATGTNPTPGFTNLIEQSPNRIHPPQYNFFSEPPSGIVPQVLTPFDVSKTFNTVAGLKSVVIHDSRGANTVHVTQS